MNIEQLSKICESLHSVTTDVKWDNHLCFNIGEKMFFIASLENLPVTASFKTTEEEFGEFISQIGFSPAPYLGRYNWVHVDDIRRLSRIQWTEIIEKSYFLIASKISKRKKLELRIE